MSDKLQFVRSGQEADKLKFVGHQLRLEIELVSYDRFDFGDRNSILQHRVTVANRALIVLKRLMINRDATGRSHFVLTAIELADSRRVVINRPHRSASLKPRLDLFCERYD